MPFSSKEGKKIIRQWVSEMAPNINHILDIGAGSGTYFKLLNQTVSTETKWSGIEIWEPNVEKYDLRKLYNNLYCEDVRKFNFSQLDFIDLAIAGDVLEHMTKEEALEVINSLFKNCKNLIISIPIIHYPQDEFEGNPFEVHVKDDYSHQEILDSFPNISKFWIGDVIGVYLLTK